MPMFGCDAHRGNTFCTSVVPGIKGTCKCDGGSTCSAEGVCSARALGSQLFETSGVTVLPEDHTAGMLTCGTLSAAVVAGLTGLALRARRGMLRRGGLVQAEGMLNNDRVPFVDTSLDPEMETVEG